MPRECLSDGVSGLVSGVAKRQACMPIEGFKHFEGF